MVEKGGIDLMAVEGLVVVTQASIVGRSMESWCSFAISRAWKRKSELSSQTNEMSLCLSQIASSDALMTSNPTASTKCVLVVTFASTKSINNRT